MYIVVSFFLPGFMLVSNERRPGLTLQRDSNQLGDSLRTQKQGKARVGYKRMGRYNYSTSFYTSQPAE
jgi:hypothetical protein